MRGLNLLVTLDRGGDVLLILLMEPLDFAALAKVSEGGDDRGKALEGVVCGFM